MDKFFWIKFLLIFFQNTRSMDIYVSFLFLKQDKHALYCNNAQFTKVLIIIRC